MSHLCVHSTHRSAIRPPIPYVHPMAVWMTFESNKACRDWSIGNFQVKKICWITSNDFGFVENLFSHYRNKGEIELDVKGDSTFEVVAQEITTFLILVGIYFPSVTGNSRRRLLGRSSSWHDHSIQGLWLVRIAVEIYVIQAEVFLAGLSLLY